MAIIYGIEFEAADKLQGYAKVNELSIVEYQGKKYLGEIVSTKNAFNDSEVIKLIKSRKEWHPRFVSHLKDTIRETTEYIDYYPEPDFHSFDYLNSNKIRESNP